MSQYLDNIIKILETVKDQESHKISQASDVVYDCLKNNGIIYAFGTGHSHIFAEELFYRAGGLAAVYPILKDKFMLHVSASKSTQYERDIDNANGILEEYPIKNGDVLFMFSNSGTNAMPVELALNAQQIGVKIICITSFEHSESKSSGHESGKKLRDIADISINNHGKVGDASIPYFNSYIGATSTVIVATILNDIVVQACKKAEINGIKFDTFVSSNTPGGDDINALLIKKYSNTIRIL